MPCEKPIMTKSKRGAGDLARDNTNVREKVQKSLEEREVIDMLVSKIKTLLIEELTTVITQKVGENLRETFEFELKTRDERITRMEKEIEQMREQQDEAEQYSRRNCLVFHGLNENEDENTNKIVKGVCEKSLSINLQNGDIDRTHRLGAKRGRSRGIIIRFTNYDARNRVYQSRKLLRDLPGDPIFIQESLTRSRSEIFKEIKSNHKSKFKSIWTQDGRIRVLTNGGHRLTLTKKAHIVKLQSTDSRYNSSLFSRSDGSEENRHAK